MIIIVMYCGIICHYFVIGGYCCDEGTCAHKGLILSGKYDLMQDISFSRLFHVACLYYSVSTIEIS